MNPPDPEIVAQLRQLAARDVLFEAAGLFWIGAELLILWGVLAGLRYMKETPGAAQLMPSDAFRRSVARWLGAFLLLCAVVLGRHLLLPSAHGAVTLGLDLSTAAAVFASRHSEHLAVWSAFVVAWVLLEGLIVFFGWRGFQQLRKVFPE